MREYSDYPTYPGMSPTPRRSTNSSEPTMIAKMAKQLDELKAVNDRLIEMTRLMTVPPKNLEIAHGAPAMSLNEYLRLFPEHVWATSFVTEKDILQFRAEMDKTVTRASALAKLSDEERKVLGL